MTGPRRCTIALAALAACWGAAPRPRAPSRDTRLALDITQVELANGLRAVIVPEPDASEVTVTVRYGVGAADDPPGKEGLAHVVEHLMYEQVRGGEALFDYLEAHALGFNGFTTPDATIYTEHALPAQLADLLELEAARAQEDCTMPATSFARQLEIVRNELRERSDSDRVRAALDEAVFTPAHPLGGRLATPATVATITQVDACTFAAAHYGPNNAVVVISGPVSTTAARAGLEHTLGRLPRVATAHADLPAAPPHRRVTVDAPVDRAWVVMAWPLPEAAAARARLRAVVGMAETLVNTRVNGLVTTLQLGAGAASQIAIAIAPSSDISISDAVDGAEFAITHMNSWFGSGLYEHAQNRAAYALAADVDDPVDRDLALAREVAAGQDARTQLDAALHAVATMTRDQAEDLVDKALDPSAATIVTLRPSQVTESGGGTLAQPFHEVRRRTPADPAEAHRPAATIPSDVNPLTRARSRRLPNGMRVVLLPLSTMPTVDIRLVFPVGTGDEPTGQRTVAVLAADALTPRDDADTLRFIQAGGRVETEIGLDHTAFVVHGLASRLDQLMSGVASMVREGTYDTDSVRQAVQWHQLAARRDASDAIATAAWRSALYGSSHPYFQAGQWSHADQAARDPEALSRFGAANYRPSDATLVVAGRFDPAIADRWVDYYFASWSGEAAPRGNVAATLQPFAFAQTHEAPQVDIELAFAATGADRVAWLVVAQMLDETIADAREALAATYGLHAQLVETRLSSTIVVRGRVDAGRASEVVALLRDRLARLREPSDETASLFVSARRHVIANLASIDVSASSLAERFVHDTALGLTVESELHAPAAAGEQTIERVAPLLDQLVPERAAVLLRGPKAAVAAAYAALGREPAQLE